MRLLYILISILSVAFPGIIVYIILWVVMPKAPVVSRRFSYSSAARSHATASMLLAPMHVHLRAAEGARAAGRLPLHARADDRAVHDRL